LYDGRDELKSVLEVADIIDELKMIRHLLQTQRDVLKPLVSALTKLNPSNQPPDASHNTNIEVKHCRVGGNLTIALNSEGTLSNSIETTKALAQGIDGRAKDNVISTDETLVAVLAGIDSIHQDADYTHRMVSIKITSASNISNTLCSCLICLI
jgi:hypothetical protein